MRLLVLYWCIRHVSNISCCEDVFIFNLLYKDILYMLYFQCNLQR
jgi:hypothetical protein